MRWQTTAALAVLLIALGAFYYLWEIRWAPEREKAEGRKGRVFTAEAADVTELTIRRSSDTVRLTREGGGWQVTEPVQARGDRGPVEETLTTIVNAKIDREIAAQATTPADFGLDKPAADVTLTLKDGKQLGLELGAKNPTGVWVYARERGKPAVFVLPEGVLRDASRPVADFRDRTLLAFERKDVAALEVVLPDDTFAVEVADGVWRLTRPRALPADTDTVTEFLDKLQTARVKEFVADAPGSRERYGLERPVRVSVHTGKDKDRATKTLLLGNVDPAKKGVYAMRPGEASVLLVPEEVWTLLPRTVAAVRNKVVVDFERDKVIRLDIESPRGAVRLVREGDKWAISQPEALPADPVEASTLLSRLKALRAQGFIAEDGGGIPRYLGKPEVRVTISTDGAAAPTTVLLAPSPDKRGGQPTAYAAVAGRGPVVLVDAKALTELGRSVTELRDRTLIGGLEPRDVKRVQVKREGKQIVLERRSEVDWRVLEPSKGPARSAKVEDLLYGLRGLKWKEIVAPKGEDPARYGLDAGASEVSLYRADGKELATVLVGKQEGDRRYVRTKAASTIYAVDARLLELPKVPDDFQG